KNCPKIRDEVPLSPELVTPLNPFSISSIHRIEGEIASAVLIAFRIFSSLLPTIPLKILPISNRNNGSCHIELIDLLIKLLPHPGTPVIRTPFGAGRPYFLAESSQDLFRFDSHRFRFSNPPTSSILTSFVMNSKIPDFLMICSFSSK